MRQRAPVHAARARKAKEFFADGQGVSPDLLWRWPLPVRCDDAKRWYAEKHGYCAVCLAPDNLDVHHLVGGPMRSDDWSNLLTLCRPCHVRFQSDTKNFGYLLYRKWCVDRWTLSWERLERLYGKKLPELMRKPTE